MSAEAPSDTARLLIDPVIEQTRRLAERVAHELPTHQGLQKVSTQLAGAAVKARRVTRSMKRPWSPHRLPVVFLTSALLGFLVFVYWQFIRVPTLSLALPDRDAASIRANLEGPSRVDVRIVAVPGSREAAEKLARGDVDLGFIQGGIAVPPGLLRLETPSRELVLYFVRPTVEGPGAVKQVLTSVANEGSHSVAALFFAAWNVPVTFVHAWKRVTDEPGFVVPDEVDAVFVVKDPSDEKTLVGAARLHAQGFRLVTPQLGARERRFDFLTATTLDRGDLQAVPPFPLEAVNTYSVTTWLVAREGLTPRTLTEAAEVIQSRPGSISERSFHLNSTEASELAQGVDALFSILVNIGLAFLALLGLDVFAYRRHFHELNSLVSIISILQSSKDVLGVEGPSRAEHLLYLSLCSDALSLISTVSGYYTQENSSLLFNNLSELVVQRCDALKINIQLKLLHAMVPTH